MNGTYRLTPHRRHREMKKNESRHISRRSGRTASASDLRRIDGMRRKIDLTGTRIGKMTVIRQGAHRKSGKRLIITWLVRCDCGVEKEMSGDALRGGRIKACGCERGHNGTHHMTRSAEYESWRGMIDRCTNPQNADYHNYGGRGISICSRWADSIFNFIEDVGPRPSLKHSIDRIDNDGNYEPDNCRWATQTEQSRNTRGCHFLTWKGCTATLAEWEERTGIAQTTIRKRIKLGWTTARALSEAVGTRQAESEVTCA